jgi:DNA-binding phage protein
MSKTQEALARVAAKEDIRVVAQDLGISTQAIYQARKREREAVRCPCCDQIIRINKAP